MKRIVSVCSARPNFVKVAAVHHALKQHAPEAFEHVLVHTGQHYDPLFSDIFFEQLGLPHPEHNLGIHGGTREEVIARTEEAFAALLPALKPDLLLVYGDVNGAVGPARVADKRAIRVGHVEAGLRSFDASMPEEWNRIEIDELASDLFCSEPSAVKNLQAENARGAAHLVGNTMIDTLVRMLPLIERAELPVHITGPFAVTTLHRPSNVDTEAALRRNVEFLADVAKHLPLVIPVHHRLKAALQQFELSNILEHNPRITLVEPMGYVAFLRIVKDSAFVLTDSGGIQEEATYLRKRCFTLRKNTERPATVESGSNVLIDLEREVDHAQVLTFAANPAIVNVTVPALWDGRAGERIVEILRQM